MLTKLKIDYDNVYRRDILKVPKKTENILKIIIPKWYKKLQKAGWNVNNMSKENQEIILCNASSCVIGELNCMSKEYVEPVNIKVITTDPKSKKCAFCYEHCEIIPARFTNRYSPEDKIHELNEIAEHALTVHANKVARRLLKMKDTDPFGLVSPYASD